MESFDVEALYTNLDSTAATAALIELLNESSINLYCFTIPEIAYLITACLNCTIFRFDGIFYKQIRGLAMGNRLAPLLAIAYMNKIERRSIDRDILLYRRYIDDILIIAKSVESLDRVFTNLHTGAIKLSRESPDSDGWLPFLNVAIRIKQGRVETVWYRKQMKKDLIIHANSAHPQRTKLQAVRNMLYTAVAVSTSRHKEAAREKALSIIKRNGYRDKELEARIRGPRYFPNAPTLRIPFISDNFSIKLQKVFLKYNVTVNIAPKSPPTLRQILVKSRLYDNKCDKPNCWICTGSSGLCKLKGVVYRITCSECAEFYVGETGRQLVDRISEHKADIRHNENRNGPWALHVRDKHDGRQIGVTVSVLSVERDLQKRKIKEAIWIKKLHPEVNARAEMADSMKFIQTF